MKKLLLIFGTRPEAIKMAPVIHQLKKKKLFIFKVCVTGQHKKLLRQVMKFFEIKSHFNLNVMTKDQSLYQLTNRIMVGVSDVLKKYKPDLVIVHGDTTTTLAVSLASYYQKINVCHIEAGLRTNNIYSPWPEEINRKLTSHLAKFHFAPTISAKKNLLLENINSDLIKVTGNTVLDSLLFTKKKILSNKLIKNRLKKKFSFLGLNKRIILVTGHRRESFGKSFENVLNALKHIALKNKDISIIFPVHLNPNVYIPTNKILKNVPNIFLVKPVDYLDFVYLMSMSYIIISDSGGIQEEAPSLGKPVLVTRDITERVEAIKVGAAKLVGTSKMIIIKNIENLLNNKKIYKKMIKNKNPYGNGHASKKIIKYLSQYYNQQ
jgi:UDP-N-acetylglucosamine 2-epimerase (non-hydrolysing)